MPPSGMGEVEARECSENPGIFQNDQNEGGSGALFLCDQDSVPFGVIRPKFMTLAFLLHPERRQLPGFPASRFFT